MKNRDYWRKRYEDLNEALLSPSDEYIKTLEGEYTRAISNIEGDIQAFYQRFAVNNGLTYDAATKLLNSPERNAFQMTVEKYIKKGMESGVSADWMNELKSASNIYHIDRLKALQLQMRHQIELLETGKLKNMQGIFTETYMEGYYRSIYELQKGMGYGTAFSTLDSKRVEQALAMTYDTDGLNFSEKIWKDRAYLARTLEVEFTQMIIRGQGPDKLIELLEKRFKVSKNAASTLVMTESASLASVARKESMESLDVEEFEIDATLDLSTCEVCGSLDGKHLPMDKYEPWVTAPPFHHRCRCTTVPYFNDEFTANEQRAARDPITGKTYNVPADMKFKDWRKEYVESNPKAVVEEKKLKNHWNDQKQYDNYKGVLGKKSVGSFADFQEMKYNDGSSWADLKNTMNSRSHLQKQLPYEYNGEGLFVPANAVINHSRAIAGKGTDTAIRTEKQVVKKYGGLEGEYTKCVGQVRSSKYIFDVHWYEHAGVQYDTKVKSRKERI